MGIVVNRLFGDLQFSGLLSQFDVPLQESVIDSPIHYGGPVDPVRGFVVHSADYKGEGTNFVTDTVSMTATVEILRDIAQGEGPVRSFTALGYAGWGAGQIEAEIQGNGWLTVPLDEDILFDEAIGSKWARSYEKLGVSPDLLVADVGHA
jgi:putative transcriptional regulator